MSLWRRTLGGLLGAGIALGCSRTDPQHRSGAQGAAQSARRAAPISAAERRLIGAEHRRDSTAVGYDDLTSRSVEQRRAAVRALARISDARSVSALRRALGDQDSEVVAWAAHGLGNACHADTPAIVKWLAARAATLIDLEERAGRTSSTLPRLSPLGAIAQALARCGSETCEQTLRGWLTAPMPRSELAARSLGLFASHHKALKEATLVALLDSASDRLRPSSEALGAFSRLGTPSPAIRQRLLEGASECLSARGPRRALAIRALGRAGPAAVPLLEPIVVDVRAAPSERADAARELVRLGDAGRDAQLRAFVRLVQEATAQPATLGAQAWAPLVTVLETLKPPLLSARRAAETLARLSLDEVSAVERRRRILLRCRSASLLADDVDSPVLRGCDPDAGEKLELAELAVLDRATLVGRRLRRWRELVQSPRPLVQQAAIKLIASHSELPGGAGVLADKLDSEHAGIAATAAQVLAARPDRAGTGSVAAGSPAEPGQPSLRPEAAVIRALERALGRAWPPDAVATSAALIDAAGSLQLLSLSSRLESHCRGPNPTLRDHARRALELLGHRDRKCEARMSDRTPPAELGSLATRPVTLRFTTDVGVLSLMLDPELAPVSVTRIVELVRSGFYDGMAVHRVVPGFIVQFGDRQGDGYGSAGRPPLRDEISPVRFEEYDVGLALSGSDTGSSQIFVTLGAFPHLDAEYPVLGQAEPGWEKLAEGDVIQKVQLL